MECEFVKFVENHHSTLMDSLTVNVEEYQFCLPF